MLACLFLAATVAAAQDKSIALQEEDAVESHLSLVVLELEKHKFYPEAAHRSGLSGRVMLRFTLRRDGEVVDPEVLEVTGHDSFREAALETLMRVGRLPVFPKEIQRHELLVEVPINFHIESVSNLGIAVVEDESDGDFVEKYRNYTPEQLKELSEETMNSEVPIMYGTAAQRALALGEKGTDLVFGMELNALMYPGLHDFEAAVKLFQKDLGDEPTGVLTVWQIHSLQQRAEMQKLARIYFPEQWSSWKSDDLASIQGTVTLLDERIAWPINHVKINCYKRTLHCEWDQINLLIPDEDSWSQSYNVMENPTDFFRITRWSENEIEGVPDSQTSTACRTRSVILNFRTEEFYEITRNAGGDCEVLGTVTLPPLSKPRIAQIVDGEKIINEEFSKIESAAFDVLASSFQKQLRELIAEELKRQKDQ